MRLAGGAARTPRCADLRERPRPSPCASQREEAGAAGAAMMAAVAIGIFRTWRRAAAAWVEPLLGRVSEPEPGLAPLRRAVRGLPGRRPAHARRLAALRQARSEGARDDLEVALIGDRFMLPAFRGGARDVAGADRRIAAPGSALARRADAPRLRPAASSQGLKELLRRSRRDRRASSTTRRSSSPISRRSPRRWPSACRT